MLLSLHKGRRRRVKQEYSKFTDFGNYIKRKGTKAMVYYQKERKNEEKDEILEKIYSIEVKRITPNPNQPRKVFSEDSIIKLADSISQYGIIQPLTVRKISESEYELVAGERRVQNNTYFRIYSLGQEHNSTPKDCPNVEVRYPPHIKACVNSR